MNKKDVLTSLGVQSLHMRNQDPREDQVSHSVCTQFTLHRLCTSEHQLVKTRLSSTEVHTVL